MRTKAIGITSADAVETGDGVWLRPETLDDEVWKEAGTYVRWMPPREGDVLLDVGANIGAVTRAYLEAEPGVAWVVGFEPEPDNCVMWRKNLAGWWGDGTGRVGARAGTAILHERAVVGGGEVDAGKVELLVSEAGNRGAHSTLRKTRSSRKKIEVAATGLGKMLEVYQPTLLKVDIEGGEYDMQEELAAVGESVRAVAIEYHLNAMSQGRARELAVEMDRRFLEQGFRVVRAGGSLETGWFVLRFYARD